MKILVTGVNGQLGHDVLLELAARGHEVYGSDITPHYNGISEAAIASMPYYQMDITNLHSVSTTIKNLSPDGVIHCAAWTAVDLAEEIENQDKVFLVNSIGTEYIAQICKSIDCKMLYLSTDYVFDGQGTNPWKPDCTAYHPLNFYGKSKLAGEIAVSETLTKYFIVRIAWVFGKNGNNFIKTMLNVAKKHDQLKVVHDQIGTPTYTFDLARLLVDMIESEQYGTYHVTNEGDYISWYDFAKEIFQQAAKQGHSEYDDNRLSIIPVTTEEYGLSKAARPFNSRLDKTKLIENGFQPLPTWKDALERYLKEIDY